MDEKLTASQVAIKQYERDALFRRSVEAAVYEAMQHFEFVESEIDRKDLHHLAVLAASNAVRNVLDGDRYLKAMEFERDAAKKMALEMAKVTPGFRVPVNPTDQAPS